MSNLLRDGRIHGFVTDPMAEVRPAYGSHTRGINNAPHTGIQSRLQQKAAAFDIALNHLSRIFNPEPVIRCYMKKHVAAGHGAYKRWPVAEITFGYFNRKPSEVFWIGFRASEA